ncbi:4Fe-4S dicluster domain-containing protein [Maledivibacter halophilus]|uniref:4Fe-4S dicluster domain-containing protein n=1 Tax=Maledivibacter halophilus TaxID=36842 RepID=A0A1T5LL51_9FIRM|nr:4Fe-4S dicluster domain-containing protein [Maledivibacter halophilus]SKC76723.1 4Fe-4S dicluster domain-containing protein [Maledivibacter halophilus]
MGLIIKTNEFSNLISALSQLKSKYNIFCPKLEDEVEHYRPLDRVNPKEVEIVEEITFQSKPPLGSIKSFLFPDSETYIKFSRRGDKLEIEEPEKMMPQIILGVKACDVRSLELIDKVFLADPVDTLYREKRDKTVIIAAICTEIGENCSCEDFGICPTEPSADILMYKDNKKEIYLKSNSKKGEKLLEQLMEIGDFKTSEIFPVPAGNGEKKLEERLSPEEIQKRMDEFFDSPLWDNLGMLCLGCGTCTYYCPTCHCYDIRDFNRKDQGVRYRTWDSCMFSNFTNMAGDHNPRPTKKDRIKNRFYHKLNYFVKKHGELSCVGCGRCAELCPVGISINTVIKKIGGKSDEA